MPGSPVDSTVFLGVCVCVCVCVLGWREREGGLVTQSLFDGAHFLCAAGLSVINTEVWEAWDHSGSHVPHRQEGSV